MDSDTPFVANGVANGLQLAGETTPLHYSDHLSLLRQLLTRCDSCLLVSPFLYREFRPLVDGLQLAAMRVELISSCASRGQDQLDKPFALRSFGAVMQEATGAWPDISINETLHSKIYVFSRDDVPFAGVVTSANLTEPGLTRNHETGIVLTRESQLRELVRLAKSKVDYVSLTAYQVDRLCDAASAFERLYGRGDRDIEVGLKNILNNYATPSAGNREVRLSENARYYIKVSGVRDRPILPEDRRMFTLPHCQLDFAKIPDRIRIGDCLLETAVGGMCFLPYYACASPPFTRSDQEQAEDPDYRRWPYYVYANNLALHYGAAWFEAPIYFDPLIEEYKRQHPGLAVTAAGGDHILGAIQMGNSCFRVTSEFGRFVRAAIDTFTRPGG